MAKHDCSGGLNIAKELAAMRQMTTGELRDKWTEVFGEQTRSRHKENLIKRIAWRLQANAEGGLSERARRRAMELANDADLRLTAPVITTKPVQMPESEITRVYKGRKIVVKILKQGFEYENEVYKSLSAVAKAVTGSHWSGHRFFGLPQKGGVR